MPYEIRNQGGSRPYCVYKEGGSESLGCHTTRAKASAQVRALYAQEQSLESLNELVSLALEAAAPAEEALAAIYERALNERAAMISSRLERMTIRAAGFVVPAPGELYEPLSLREREELAEAQQDASERIAAILLIPLGLGFLGATIVEKIAFRSADAFDEAVLTQLRTIVEGGLREGLTAAEIAGAVQSSFEGSSASSAQMLARTQITALTNEASLTAARSLEDRGIYKRWTTVGDARVRVPHARAEGQTKPLNAVFEVGGSQLMYPGDPSAPIALTANCRCIVTYTRSLPLTASASTVSPVDELAALESDLAALTHALEPEAVVPVVVETSEESIAGMALQRLERATMKERYEGYEIGMRLGLLSQNDCLRSEGLEPVEGGEQRVVLGQTVGGTETLKVVLGNEMSETTVEMLNTLSARIEQGEKVNEGMLAALRELATMQASPPTVVVNPILDAQVTVEPQITVEPPQITVEPTPVNVTVEPTPVEVQVSPVIEMPSERRSVVFERDAAGRISGATIDDEE